MLPYRVNLYVVLPSSSETLTAGYVRYIVGIDVSRTVLTTLQPSEPILTVVSPRIMTISRCARRDVVKALHDSLTSGAIHIGDVGEIVAGFDISFLL